MKNIDYKSTLNLPKSEFSMRANLAIKEPQLQAEWDRINIYQKIREKRKNSPKYILHDGPPYANGNIHLGHALNKILKDLIIKYKTMRGYDAVFIPGWDCHGLPIELAVAEKYKISQENKKLLRQKCKEYALHFAKVQSSEFQRLGVFADWENPYMTLDKDYVASVIEIFYQLLKSGYIYRSLKPVYWCINCKTAQAEAEVEYKEVPTSSIYVKFPIIKGVNHKSSSFLVWTTTPWTLPANQAVCLHPEYNYSLCQIREEEHIIVAEDLIKEIEEKLSLNLKAINTYKGKELEDIICKHPFLDKKIRIVLDKYVKKTQGTGCVHIAPGHGLEDYEVGLKYNLQILSPIDESGRFLKEEIDCPTIHNLGVFEAEPKIIELIKEKNNLLYHEELIHSYPHCWRCKNKVVFRATKQWFINLNKNNLKERILNSLDKIKWQPKWAQERFRSTLAQRSDWCISRQRAWGVSIPVIYCKSCESILIDDEIINKVKRLIEEFDKDSWFELKPEDLIPADYRCKNCRSKEFQKEEDILDVWLESGASFYAVLKKKKELLYPADLYVEGSDQHRGWFQSSILLSFATDNTPPYKGVITHGFILDEENRAMHKSLGNVISPQEIIETYGADVLRLWVASEDYTKDLRFGKGILVQCVDMYRKIRNTIRFMLANLYDFDKNKDNLSYDSLLPQDKWILHKFQGIIEEVTKAYENFDFHKVVNLLVNTLCINYLSSFYLDILKDRLYVLKSTDIRRKSAQFCLYYLLTELLKLIAPILSHTAEEAYKYLNTHEKEESIHLCDFPKVKPEYINPKIEKNFEFILSLREKIYVKLEDLRKSNKLGSSLEAKVKISVEDEEKFSILQEYKAYLPEIFIVSQVIILHDKQKLIEVDLAEGNKCQRCWMYSESVTETLPLCQRCQEIINSLSS